MNWTKENIPDLSGKSVIVTGSNVGVGYETALALYEKGANVTMASRNLKNAEEAIGRMQNTRRRFIFPSYTRRSQSLRGN